jgi:hypothetical protein
MLLRMIGSKIDVLLADGNHDADAVREAPQKIEVEAAMPSKGNRKQPRDFHRDTYSSAG